MQASLPSTDAEQRLVARFVENALLAIARVSMAAGQSPTGLAQDEFGAPNLQPIVAEGTPSRDLAW
jgi:hypothetical protein